SAARCASRAAPGCSAPRDDEENAPPRRQEPAWPRSCRPSWPPGEERQAHEGPEGTTADDARTMPAATHRGSRLSRSPCDADERPRGGWVCPGRLIHDLRWTTRESGSAAWRGAVAVRCRDVATA